MCFMHTHPAALNCVECLCVTVYGKYLLLQHPVGVVRESTHSEQFNVQSHHNVVFNSLRNMIKEDLFYILHVNMLYLHPVRLHVLTVEQHKIFKTKLVAIQTSFDSNIAIE